MAKVSQKMEVTPVELEYMFLQVARYAAWTQWIISNSEMLSEKYGQSGNVFQMKKGEVSQYIEDWLRTKEARKVMFMLDKIQEEMKLWDMTVEFNNLSEEPLQKVVEEDEAKKNLNG